jgi:hypothetical protein
MAKARKYALPNPPLIDKDSYLDFMCHFISTLVVTVPQGRNSGKLTVTYIILYYKSYVMYIWCLISI